MVVRLDGEIDQRAGCRQVGAETQAEKCNAERHDRPCGNGNAKRANDRIVVDRLKVGTQKRNH